MAHQDDIKFHSDRAKAEFDRALGAGSTVAAEAHFRLSALHLERIRNLTGPQPLGPVHAH